jgi:hypothetical protein
MKWTDLPLKKPNPNISKLKLRLGTDGEGSDQTIYGGGQDDEAVNAE